MPATRHRFRHAEDRSRRTATGAVEVGDEVQDSHGSGTLSQPRPGWRKRQVLRVRLTQAAQRLWGRPCRDAELAFVVATYRQTELLERCLGDLRRFYPRATLLVVADGDPDPRLEPICARAAGTLLRGERLKLPGLGGAYWQRMAQAFADTGCEYLVKVDPDSRFERRFRYLSRAGFFGTVIGRDTPYHHVQGGCQVLRRRTVLRWLASGLLDDPVYRDVDGWCEAGPLRQRLLDYQQRSGVLAVDHMLFDMMRRLGVRAVPWHEVACWWPRPPLCPRGLFAITHPHPLAAAEPRGDAPPL
ncbi:MAG: hypothetical protein AAF560_08495 [Acidobacteriota bacterium]